MQSSSSPIVQSPILSTLQPSETRTVTGPGSSVGKASASGRGGRGFKSRPGHTKVFKNGTSCSSLGAQTYGVELELVTPVSG